MTGVANDGSVTSSNVGSYRRPLVHGDPVEVDDRVFVIRDDRIPLVPNIGIVVGDRGVLVIDTGAGPGNGKTVLRHAQRLADGKPITLAITQFDPGHGFGVQAFRDTAMIVMSVPQRDRMHHHGDAYAETFRSDLGAEVRAELEGLEFVEPDVIHSGQMELDLGGVTAVLKNWGPSHTLDDQTVLVDDRVLFGGDLFQTRMFAILPYFPPFDTDFNGDAWIAALDEQLTLPVNIVIPGHGEVTDLNQVRQVRDYLAWVRARTQSAKDEGATLRDTEASMEREARLRHPDWDEARWARTATRAFWGPVGADQ